MIHYHSCTGRETSIVDCMKDAWYQHDCPHYSDAGVDCFRKSCDTNPVFTISDGIVITVGIENTL